MRAFIRVVALFLALALSSAVFSLVTVQDSYLRLEVDDATFAFDMGTPSPQFSDLLFGYPGAPWSTHTVVKVDNIPFDLQSVGVTTPLATGATFIEGAKTIGDINVKCHWGLVINPATGTLLDTAEFKYTLTNTSATTPHNVALRLELDTKVIQNDGTNISIDNGFNVITQNTVFYKSLNQVPSNWWDYDQPPPFSTLVGRGYNKNNNPAYDPPAVEPDIMEVANWTQVSDDAQWTLAPAGDSIPPAVTPVETPDSAVVLWWCNGDQNSPGFTLAPNTSITFLTYYGLNREPLLTTPTATRTLSSTYTVTYTRTITQTYTITQTSSITETPTISQTFTNSPTITQTHTFTDTPTITQTSSVTPTITETSTFTDTPTVTPTFTVTPTHTDTPTFTVTFTVTQTSTDTDTPTITPTFTPTPLPLLLDLKGNFPDPFIIDTQIVYKLSVDADVKIKIFDVSGETVRQQGNIAGKAGYNSFFWDGRNRGNKPVASGIFIYRIEASTNRGEHATGMMKAACVK